MPKYFFHVHSAKPSHDEVGEDLPDDETAWRAATRFAGEVMRDINGKFRPGQDWSLEVMNEARKPIYFITIGSRKLA
ncbi:DUF6894 family protein [Bradyrhizobium sp. 5.13L]